MKLFVSDLDGTLLNSNAKVSDNTKKILNDLIGSKGLKFTVATARTPATAVPILEGIDINMPAVMMNGVLLYNLKEKKYLDIKSIDKTVVKKICGIFKEAKKDYFAYGIKDNKLVVYYRNMNRYEEKYYEERCGRPLKTFIHVEDYDTDMVGAEIINFVVLDTYDNLKGIEEKLQKIEEVTVNLYEDLYGDGNFFMDVYNSNASKANAIKSISERYLDGEKIIAFGDNINDIPMFEEADECYAVENAADRLKKIATGIIGNHNDDAVAQYLREIFK